MNLLIFNLKTDADDSVLGFTTDWINALAKKCNRVVVITMGIGRLAVADNVTVFSLGKEKGYSKSRRLIEFYRLLWQVLQKNKIDYCFAHMNQLFAIFGWPLLRPRRIPIVLWYTHSKVSTSLRLATWLVNKVVSANKSSFRIETNKVEFIGHGIDINRFSPSDMTFQKREKLILLTVGRISPIKRLEVALEAMCMLSAEAKTQVELRYIGDSLDGSGENYAWQLKQKVNSLGISDLVRFQPALPFHQIQEAYQTSDIFINCSDTDSIDKSVLEAMSCGLPVVTSNIAFSTVFGPELAANWLIPKNDPIALSKCLMQLIEMGSDKRQNLGIELRNIVKNHHSLPTLATRLTNNILQEVELNLL